VTWRWVRRRPGRCRASCWQQPARRSTLFIVEKSGDRSIAFGPEADGFEAALAVLCDATPAVTLLLRSGDRFGAVLVSVHDGVLIYEHWDEGAGQPTTTR